MHSLKIASWYVKEHLRVWNINMSVQASIKSDPHEQVLNLNISSLDILEM